MCQLPMPVCSSVATGTVYGPVATSGPNESHRGTKRDWMAIPLMKDLEGRYAFEAIISASALPAMDSGTVSFVILAAGMLGYLRIRKRYKLAGLPLSGAILAQGQELLQRWRRLIRAKLRELFSRSDPPPKSLLLNADADNIPDQDGEPGCHGVDAGRCLIGRHSDDSSTSSAHDSGPSLSPSPPPPPPPTPVGASMQRHLRETLEDAVVPGDDMSDDGDLHLRLRTPSPFQRFYNRLPGFPSWTVVNQADVPSPSPSPHEESRRRHSYQQLGSQTEKVSAENDDVWAGDDVVDVETVYEGEAEDDDEDDADYLTTEEVEIDDFTPPSEMYPSQEAGTDPPPSPPPMGAGNDVKWYLRPFRKSPSSAKSDTSK